VSENKIQKRPFVDEGAQEVKNSVL